MYLKYLDVQLPTDYHMNCSATDLLFCPGELGGFIDSKNFDCLVIGVISN